MNVSVPSNRVIASLAVALALMTVTSAGAGAVESPELARVISGSSVDEPTLTPAGSRQAVNAAVQSLGTPLGTMRIPAIGVAETIRAGVDISVINRGPAYWVGTSAPGGPGNLVLAGHRTTYSAPFHDLDKLAPGDLIYFSTASGHEVRYRVEETLFVTPDDIWITYETGRAIATLFACHPKGSARQRIVIRASLLGGGLIS